jgi:histidyl-tRNA synthetase
MGMERILLALGETQLETAPFCFIAPIGAKAGLEGLKLARRLREQGVRAELDGRGNSLKSMLRRANTMGARFCLVFGDAELERGMVQLKDLSGHEQSDLETNEAIARIVQACTAPAGSTT